MIITGYEFTLEYIPRENCILNLNSSTSLRATLSYHSSWETAKDAVKIDPTMFKSMPASFTQT